MNFWLGLILLQLVLALSLTGYLLPWDQKGYWATRVATNLLSVVPLVGPQLQQLVVGGADYGHLTLTRFFALHAGVLPGLLTAFLVLHVALFRRHGLCHKQPSKGPDAMFWPDQILKDAVACLAVLAVVLLLVVRPVALFSHEGPIEAAHLGAELGGPADPSNQYSAARPEWYFLFLFQFLKLFEGWGERGELMGAVVIPTLALGVLFLMPLVGRWKLGHRFNLAFVVIMLAGIAYLTGAAVTEDYRARWTDPASFADLLPTIDAVGTDETKIAAHFENDPVKIHEYRVRLRAYESYRKSNEYLQAVAQANQEAARIRVLAAGPGKIPASGANALLRNDPMTQGPKLFAQHCASCHTHVAGRPKDAVQADSQPAANSEPSVASRSTKAGSTAPNLDRFASRAWIAGFLDPKHIAGPEYFGNTSHRDGTMVGFVTDTLASWPTEEVQNIVLALSAEAGLKSQARCRSERCRPHRSGPKADCRCRALRLVSQISQPGRTRQCARSNRLWLSRMARGHDQQSEGRAELSGN